MDRQRRARVILIPAMAAVVACGDRGTPVEDNPQNRFWEALAPLCGQAFSGSVEDAPVGDTLLTGKRLVMDVLSCESDEVQIAFHVGDDRSRTWMLTRTDSTMALAHRHRHRDGSPTATSGYGGVTRGAGTASLQEFPADAATAESNPNTRTNVWSLAVHPGESFTYGLHRLGTDRRFRVRFDLTESVQRPPPPW